MIYAANRVIGGGGHENLHDLSSLRNCSCSPDMRLSISSRLGLDTMKLLMVRRTISCNISLLERSD